MLLFTLTCFFLVVSINAGALSPGPEVIGANGAPEPSLSLLDRADQSQQILSSKLHQLSHHLDSFFGSSRVDEETRSDSRIRINFLANFQDGAGDSYGANIRTRIALPNTERRFNLVLQNFSRSFQDDRSTDKPTIGETFQKGDYAAGLRYQPEVPSQWSFGADTGVKLVIPPDPFVRLRVRRTWWPANWEVRAIGTVFWFDSQGFGHTQALEFDRQISSNLLFRFDNNASWLRSDDQYHFDQGLGLFQKVSDQWAFNYFLRMAGNDDPVPHAEDYALGINFRRRIRPEWFFLNIQPAGNWPRTQRFGFVPSISFKLEVIIGES